MTYNYCVSKELSAYRRCDIVSACRCLRAMSSSCCSSCCLSLSAAALAASAALHASVAAACARRSLAACSYEEKWDYFGSISKFGYKYERQMFGL